MTKYIHACLYRLNAYHTILIQTVKIAKRTAYFSQIIIHSLMENMYKTLKLEISVVHAA